MFGCNPSYSDDDRLAWRAAQDTESESARHFVAPLFESTLKRTQLSVWKPARTLTLQTLEQIFSGSIWIDLEPVTHCWPRGLERVFPRPPMP
jgi:hypothetical protein